MEAKSQGKFTYRHTYQYIKDEKYPEVLRKCDELARRKRSQIFKVQEVHLYYTGGMFLLMLYRLAINHLHS